MPTSLSDEERLPERHELEARVPLVDARHLHERERESTCVCTCALFRSCSPKAQCTVCAVDVQ